MHINLVGFPFPYGGGGGGGVQTTSEIGVAHISPTPESETDSRSRFRCLDELDSAVQLPSVRLIVACHASFVQHKASFIYPRDYVNA